jgi:membrane protease YdiL (CAAX protease family)
MIEPHPRHHLSVGRSIALAAIFVGFQLGISIAATMGILISGGLDNLSKGLENFAPVLLIGNTLAMLCTWEIARRWLKLPWVFWPKAVVSEAKLLPLTCVVVLANVLLALSLTSVLFSAFPALAEMPEEFESLFDLTDPWLTGPLALVVMAPLTEEIIFRALILGGLLRRYSPRKSILISAAIFSAIHLHPVQVPATFALGIVFGIIYYRTRSLWLCVFGHALHNGVALLSGAAQLAQVTSETSASPAFDSTLLAISLPAAVVLWVGLLALRRFTPEPVIFTPPPLPPPESPPPLPST